MRLIEQLEPLGFFTYSAPDDISAEKEQTLASGSIYPPSRLNFADAEDLAEGGIKDFFADVRPFLESQGIYPLVQRREITVKEHDERTGEVREVRKRAGQAEDIPATIRDGIDLTIKEEYDDSHYTVWINRKPIVIYDANTIDDSWLHAALQTVAILNALLEESGSAERAYSLYGGNDHMIVFLTPEMVELINQSPAVAEGERIQEMGLAGR